MAEPAKFGVGLSLKTKISILLGFPEVLTTDDQIHRAPYSLGRGSFTKAFLRISSHLILSLRGKGPREAHSPTWGHVGHLELIRD